MLLGARSRRDFFGLPALEWILLVLRRGFQRAFPTVDLVLVGRAPQPAVRVVMGVDALSSAKFTDGGYRIGGSGGQAHSFLAAANFLEREKFGPPAQHEAAIAPAGAIAADARWAG